MQCHDTKWPDTGEYLEEFIAKAEQLHIPLAGSLELTHRCNLNCVHCYLGQQAKRQVLRDREMSAARIHTLIDEITEAGCLNLLITGGEPLLREDFPEIYRHAKGNGLLVTVFTNGTIIGEKTIELFCDLPPVEVEISVYGATEHVYESITSVHGSYKKCLLGIRGLLENGVRVNLKTILMTINRHEFTDMENMAKELGVRFRFDAAISPRMDGDNSPLGLRVPPEEAIEKEMSGAGKVESWKTFFEKFKDRTLGSGLYGCGAGLTAFHIDPFGHILPCMMALDMRYDISEAGFKEGWDNIMHRIRDKKTAADFACRGCVKINLCGYCPGFFRLENGLEDVPSEYICRMGGLRYEYIHDHAMKGDHGGQPEKVS
ncbi:MAG: radical SAM protein [Thermodesulfovibrionales bacterium]